MTLKQWIIENRATIDVWIQNESPGASINDKTREDFVLTHPPLNWVAREDGVEFPD